MSRISSQAGVKYRIHDGRSRLQTALENVGVSVNWVRKAKGRKVKAEESPYSKPAVEQLRAKYREALPDLEFLTTTNQVPQTPQQDFSSSSPIYFKNAQISPVNSNNSYLTSRLS